MRYVLLLIAVTAFIALACGGGGGGETKSGGGDIVLQKSALDALDAYAFTSHAEISSPDGELNVDFDAKFQAPDKIQGTARFSDESGDLPGEIEIISIPSPLVEGEAMWLREPGGEWQQAGGDEGSWMATAPLQLLTSFGSPPLYLQTFG